jgi:hypothetical protein
MAIVTTAYEYIFVVRIKDIDISQAVGSLEFTENHEKNNRTEVVSPSPP